MAKSIRSKWKRKMRASKRERYGKKELERLKTMLGINTTDVEMKEETLNEIAVVKDANDLKNKKATVSTEEMTETEKKDDESEPMDDGRRIFNKKTWKDQHGNYPVWLGSRKLKKVVKRNQKTKHSSKKKQKKIVKNKSN